MDVPYHFFDDGKKLTDYDASEWIFRKPQLIDVPSEDGYLVTYNDVSSKINKETDLLLIRTGYEKFRREPKYYQENPGLSADLAKGLRENYQNICALGVDIISITSIKHRVDGRNAHREFLSSHFDSKPIVLIEDMLLQNFINDISQVIILPLLIQDADGAPCTVIGKVFKESI